MADYAAMAVAPLLIVLMISSLANFLVPLLYQGSYPQRVSWTLLMFTLGAVGIARVAIEQNRAHSLGYAVVLGLVTWATLLSFVGSPIFSAFALALIGYLSDRVVRDCTIIDDSVDVSGRGLIDSGRRFLGGRLDREEQPTAPAVAGRKRGKTHQPGRTVMYLALAALPLFGLGQFLLGDDPVAWSRCQWLLGVYLFASLGLLVTTSFLGLRRYLRQRKVDMPRNVSVAWLAGGCVLAAAIVSLAYLAPLPGQAIASFQPPAFLDSPDELFASRSGWGDEGAEKSGPQAAQTSDDPREASQQPGGVRAEQGARGGDAGAGERSDGPAGSQGGGQQASGGSGDSPQQSSSGSQTQDSSGSDTQGSETGNFSGSRSGASSSDSSTSSSEAGNSSSEAGNSSSEAGDSSSEGNTAAESESGGQTGDQQTAASDPQSASPADRQRTRPPQNQSHSRSQPADRSSGSGARSTSWLPQLGTLFRSVVLLVLAAVVIGFLWLYRDQIGKWWRDLLAGSRAERSSEPPEGSAQAAAAPPPRAFASFHNPIGTEPDPRRAVVVTFQAFEAWSREHGWQRNKDETPSEFIARVARSMPEMSTLTRQLVEAYNRIVYGRGQASQSDVNAASQLWQVMHRG